MTLHKKYCLTGAGKLAAVVTLAFLLGEIARADGIAAAEGGAAPRIGSAPGGATVIDIVAPSQSGLSHNRYRDFNVDKNGVVFNNSLNGGDSVLAGSLAGNRQLAGREANIILNEVVSRNPSLLLGRQEVLGHAADYVLANPNGISCSGCGFINTPRVSLLVGTPLVENGSLQGLVSANNRNSLQVNGIRGMEVLDLIAPRIETAGEVAATRAINAFSGSNSIDYVTGAIVASSAVPEGTGSLDSVFLGGMQAGRISLIATTAGAGINLSGEVRAKEDIRVASAGEVVLEGAALSGRSIDIKGSSVASRARLESESHVDENKTESWFIWKTGETRQVDMVTKEAARHTLLDADQVGIVASGEAHLAGTDIQGGAVTIRGATVRFSGQLTKQSNESASTAWLNSWERNRTSGERSEQQHGVRIDAARSMSLDAGAGDMVLQGARLESAGVIRISASGAIGLEALRETTSRYERGNGKNDGPGLETGSWSTGSSRERLEKTLIAGAGGVGVSAGAGITSRAAEISSREGDVLLAAKSTLTLDRIATLSTVSRLDDHSNWGGLAGGLNSETSDLHTENTGSRIQAGGRIMLNGDEGIRITASKVASKGGSQARTVTGGVVIDAALDQTVSHIDENDRTVFNISRYTDHNDSRKQQSVGSELVSEVDLTVHSAKDLAVEGSMLKAAGRLGLEAVGAIRIGSSVQQYDERGVSSELAFRGVGEESSPEQYRGGFRLEQTTTGIERRGHDSVGSDVAGGSVEIKAVGSVAVQGARIKSRDRLDVSGQSVAVTAQQDSEQRSDSLQVAGGGMYVTAGAEKTGLGLEIGMQNRNTTTDSRKARVSSLEAGGALSVIAGGGHGEMRNEGSVIKATGTVSVVAGTIDNQAAISQVNTTTDTSGLSGDLGLNVDYSGITRPLEKAGRSMGQGNVVTSLQQALGMTPISLGGDLLVAGSSATNSTGSRSAEASRVSGGSVAITANGALSDQGTRYQADKGRVDITADSHRFDAAVSSGSGHSLASQGSASLRVDTTTGEDINANGKGKGRRDARHQETTDARAGSIRASEGIAVTVRGEGSYRGTEMNAGNGALAVTSGGALSMGQVSQDSASGSDALAIEVGLGINTTPFAASRGGAVSGRAKVQVDDGTAKQSSAQGAALAGNGVTIRSGAGVVMQGGSIDSRAGIDVRAEGRIDLNSADGTVAASGHHLDVDAALGGKRGAINAVSAGGGGGIGQVSDTLTTRQGTRMTAQNTVRLQSGANAEDAIHLRGTTISTPAEVQLASDSGGTVLESAATTQQRNNWSAGLSVSGSRSTPVPGQSDAAPAAGIKGGVKVAVDQLDSVTHHNSVITADQVVLDSDSNLTLSGAEVTARTVRGNVAGNLQLGSRQDLQSSAKVDIDVGASQSSAMDPGLVKQGAKLTGPFKARVEAAGSNLVNRVSERVANAGEGMGLPAPVDSAAKTTGNFLKDRLLKSRAAGVRAKAKIDVNVERNDAVVSPTVLSGREGVDLAVGGDTRLDGASLRSEGKVRLGEGAVTQSRIVTHHYQGSGGVTLDDSVAAIVEQAGKDILSGKAPLIRAGRHTEDAVREGGIEQAR